MANCDLSQQFYYFVSVRSVQSCVTIDAVESPSLDMLESQWDMALSNLLWLDLLWVGGAGCEQWSRWPLKADFKSNYSMILFLTSWSILKSEANASLHDLLLLSCSPTTAIVSLVLFSFTRLKCLYKHIVSIFFIFKYSNTNTLALCMHKTVLSHYWNNSKRLIRETRTWTIKMRKTVTIEIIYRKMRLKVKNYRNE